MTIWIVIALIAIAALLSYLILFHGPWPRRSDFSIDFSRVRELAADTRENLPSAIRILTVATGELPGWGVVAGDFGGKPAGIDFPSFQIVYRDKTAIIEAPFNKKLFDKFPYGKDFDKANYQTMQRALLAADFILPTHEHWDHLGGIAQSEHIDALLPKTIFTQEQLHGPTIADAQFPEGSLDGYTPLVYDTYHRAAPGVVLIKAPGHSAGHQFVYVQLQDGREYLFTGDVCWVNRNLEKRRNRPWLASKKRLENRRQIAHQMRYLHDEFYANRSQKIIQISTHDPAQHARYIREGLLEEGFQL